MGSLVSATKSVTPSPNVGGVVASPASTVSTAIASELLPQAGPPSPRQRQVLCYSLFFSLTQLNFTTAVKALFFFLTTTSVNELALHGRWGGVVSGKKKKARPEE